MKLSLLNHITCPRCQSKLYLGRSINRHDEVFHGTLQCQDEGHVFAIDNGVPDFLSPETSVSQLKVADTYSKKWRMMPDYGYSEATLQFQRDWYLQKFGWKTIGNFRKYLSRKQRVLDAGCGLGRDVRFFAENTKGVVLGVDISDSVYLAYEKLGHLPNVHIVKADMMAMPFPVEHFDFISCDQALHHTSDTRFGFEFLLRHLKKRGQISVYVYKKKSKAREFTDDLIRKYTTEMSYDQCMIFAAACAEFGRTVSNLNLDLQRDIYWNVFKCFWDGKYDFQTNALINLDWYHPKYAWRHTPEQVKGWCEELDIKVKAFDICESGISVRGVK